MQWRTCALPCTGCVTNALKQHIFRHVLTYMADGAAPAQKCGKLLRAGPLPHITLIIRDGAHALRTATQDPVKLQDEFGRFWSDIFDSRHALVPDIQNSHAWRSKLLLAQRHILKHNGRQGGGLAVALRHLSFAKQRFDSAAAPARKYCCLLSAIALLPIAIAADARLDGAVQRRAQRLLDLMTPRHIVTAGLFADYTAETLRFVRRFDVDDHDLAGTLNQKRHFLQRMRLLFKQAHVLATPPPGVTGGGMMCTWIAISQAMECGPIYYLDRCLNLWPAGAKEEALGALDAMQEVVGAMEHRVEAELHVKSLLLDFAAFDLALWHEGLKHQEAGRQGAGADVLAMLSRRARRVATAHPFVGDVDQAVRELESVARELRTLLLRDLEQGGGVDNRWAWARVMGPGFADGRDLRALPPLVAWYLSIMDGTGPVERGLGRLTQVLASHVGPLDQDGSTASALLEVSCEGPTTEAELAFRRVACSPPGVACPPLRWPGGVRNPLEGRAVPGEACSGLLFTEFTRRCAELWVAHHGRRFCVYASGHPGRKRPRPGTDAAVVRGQVRVADALVARAKDGTAAGGHQETILGVPRSHFVRSGVSPRPPGRGTPLARFQKLSTQKEAAQVQQAAARARGWNPYPAPPLRLGALFRDVPAVHPRPVPPLGAGRGSILECLDATAGEVLRKGAGYRIVKLAGGAVWAAVRTAHLIILDSLGDIDTRSDGSLHGTH